MQNIDHAGILVRNVDAQSRHIPSLCHLAPSRLTLADALELLFLLFPGEQAEAV